MVNDVNGASQSVIQSLNISQKSEQLNNQQTTSDTTRSETSDNTSVNSDVSLTSTGELLNRVESQIRVQPVVDTQRVNQIRAAILDGSFQVDSTRAAEKFIQFESIVMSDTQGSETEEA